MQEKECSIQQTAPTRNRDICEVCIYQKEVLSTQSGYSVAVNKCMTSISTLTFTFLPCYLQIGTLRTIIYMHAFKTKSA